MANNHGAIQLHIRDQRASITLNRPERHNALEQDDMFALIAVLEEVENTLDVRVLTITGHGEKTFCAGASLRQVGDKNLRTNVFSDLTNHLENMAIPTICALNGSVYGGGVELALCCDYRIGLPGTRLFVPAAKLGLCYRLQGLQRYVTRLGVGPAKRILMANETLDATEMHRIGFLDFLVERTELESFAADLAERITLLAPLAVQGMKRIINQVATAAVDMEEVKAIIDGCAASEDLQEGLRAQAEKREPVFIGL